MTNQTMQITPPPWTLTGNGYIILYKFPKLWGEQYAHIPQMMIPDYKGGIGAMMLVDYHTSNIGPYRELLFAPGMFTSTRAWTYSITRIFVSTRESVINGRENWNIPKEHAEFNYESTQNGERIRVNHNGKCVFDAQFTSSQWKIPINTAWSPIKPSIIQYGETNDQPLRTQPMGKGRVARSRLLSVELDPEYVPDIRMLKPLLSLRATDFTLKFPHPKNA